MSAAHIPVILLTGFLGAGKTTLLNRLLARADMADTLVIVNEFGEASLDHRLVTHTDDQTVVELASGCICCTLRSGLAQTLRDAHWRFARAGRRQFERIVIESTGLADPAPVLRTLTADARIAERYRLGCTLTVVDATHAAATLAMRPEAVRQVAAADRLLISKADLASADDFMALRHVLGTLNPFAPQLDLRTAALGPALFEPPRIARYRPSPHTLAAEHAVRADSVLIERPLPRQRFDAWLAAWPDVAGPGLLRMKGLFDLAGESRPLIVQGVQHALYPPTPLPSWPDATRGSTVVCITQGIDDTRLQAWLSILRHD
ncbi:GTP-binding protein [Methyloversatilis sp.]|uniref:CobW family GTP-binding protein n=1 Tax=Methyloversatilis sp. TaxID=2569862 RepID=UPI0035B33219